MRLISLLLLFEVFQLAAAHVFKASIKFPESPKSWAPRTHISLLSLDKSFEQHQTFLREDNSFQFNVSEGTYQLMVDSLDFKLSPDTVTIHVYSDGRIKAYGESLSSSITTKGAVDEELTNRLRTPLEIHVAEQRQYFVNKKQSILESGPIATILNNKLYLSLAIFAITFSLGPSVMQYIDPDFAEKYENAQREMRANGNTPPTDTDHDGGSFGQSKAGLAAADMINNFNPTDLLTQRGEKKESVTKKKSS